MERLTRPLREVWKKLFKRSSVALRGATDPLSREYLGSKPANEAVSRFSAASEIRKIVDKDSALVALTNAYIGARSDYAYNTETYQMIINEAKRKAEEFGATSEEISNAINEGRLLGAQEDMRLNNDW